MINDWSHKVRAILKEYCPGNIKKLCPPCHKAGIHDFILAIKSSVWIIMLYNVDARMLLSTQDSVEIDNISGSSK